LNPPEDTQQISSKSAELVRNLATNTCTEEIYILSPHGTWGRSPVKKSYIIILLVSLGLNRYISGGDWPLTLITWAGAGVTATQAISLF